YSATAPTIALVTPNTGSTAGGTFVNINGTGFTGVTAVTFGGVPAASVTVINDLILWVTTPPHAAGAVTLVVTSPDGSATLPNGFIFTAPMPTISSVAPNSGPPTGGTLVTISGTGFTGATAVTFDGTAATGV